MRNNSCKSVWAGACAAILVVAAVLIGFSGAAYAQSAPSNDNFANAITISGSAGSTTGSNVGATMQTGEPNFSMSSVWWRWTAPTNGTAVFDTIGSNFDSELGIYTGNSVSTLTTILQNSDSGGGQYYAAKGSFTAAAGTVYYIAVTGFAGHTGSIQLNWQLTAAPPNDNFSSAITLSGSSGTTTGQNLAATREAGEPSFGNTFSVWWKWTAPANGNVVWDTIGSDFDSELGIYSGNSVSTLTTIGQNSDSGGGAHYAARVSFNAVSGTVYYIAVTGFSSATGNIQVNWQFTGAPPNDNFSGAITLSGRSGSTIGSNAAATRETGEPTWGNAYSVWWKWTAPGNGPAVFDTIGSNFDSEMGIYTGSSVSALTPVGQDHDSGGGANYAARISFTAVSGTVYYIAVTGFSSYTGNIQLNWNFTGSTTTPPTSGTTITSFTWQNWRQRAAENNNVAYQGSNNWVRYLTTGALSFQDTGTGSYIEDFIQTTQTFAVEGIRIEWDMTATIATTLGYVGPYVLLTKNSGSGWNSESIGAQVFYGWESLGTKGAVLHAGRMGNPTIASNPSVPGVNDGGWAHHVVTVNNGVVTWSVNGQTLASQDMGSAPYAPMPLILGARLYDSGVTQIITIQNLTVTTASTGSAAPSNDAFSNATTITGNSGTANGSNVGATRETGEPSIGGSNTVWWKWTAPATGNVTFTTQGSDFDTFLAAYTGSTLASLSNLAQNDDSASDTTSSVTFSVTAGTTYYIAVSGFSDHAGNIQLNWQLTPGTGTIIRSFTWQSWRQRSAENNNVAYRGDNGWVNGGDVLVFQDMGHNSYIEDFLETTQTFAVEGIRIEWDMMATIGTNLGYVGPYVLLTRNSGSGWNSTSIGAQVFYGWESQGTKGAALHAGRMGNPPLSSNPSVPGINDGTSAHHVVTVSNGVVTWTVNGQTFATQDMGPAPYAPMPLIVGARLYDSGVSQFIEIRNLTVTTAGGSGGSGNSTTSFSITNRGGLSQSTDGVGNLVQGYTRIRPSSGSTTPAGVAIFGFRQNNVLVSETGVPASALVRNGRIYAEVSANAQLNTGIAIANPNSQDASITFQITNSGGTVVKSGSFTLGANQQRAAFLDGDPFLGPKPIQGALSFNSNVPISVIALRTFVNERSDFLMTTLPVIDTLQSVATGTLFIPHFADGAGFTTHIFLVNPTDSILTGNVQFYSQGSGSTSGTPTSVTVGGLAGTIFPYSVPGGSSVSFSTAGTSATLTQGSVRVIPVGDGMAPVPLLVFTYKPGAYTLSEAGVPAIQGSAFRMYAQALGTSGAAGSIQSGFAIANTSASAGTLTLELTNLDGSTTGLPGSVNVTLPGSGQIVGLLNTFFPSLTSFRGVLRISTTTSGISVVGIRSRYNETGGYLMTTTPPINEAAASSSAEMYFPHIVNGGGFTTEFIVFSGTAGQSSNGNLEFFRDDGTSLTLTLN